MPESIGPVIKVTGEAEFKKSIENINKEFKLLGSEMKLAASQFDKNDKSTQALTARNQVLGKEIDSEKGKISLLTTQYDKQNKELTTLKTKLDATKEAFGADSAEVAKAQREYDKQNNTVMGLQTELNKATTGLNNMDRALQENNRNIALQESAWTKLGNKLNDVGDRMKKVGDGMKDVGKKMSTSVTAPIMAIGAAAVAAFTDVDKGMDTIIKKTGASGETAKELEKIYKDIAGSVPDSMEAVGAAVGELNTRFDFTGDTLKKASEDFLKFARINDMDVNSSVQLVSRAMGDAGIESSEYGSVLDMLTVAAQKSGIGVEELTGSLTKYGAPMRALGIDTETSIAMFAGWEKAGVNTEIAFSGMKQAIGKWGKEGKDSTKEFEKTLKAIKDAPDITTATGMAIEIFGQRAGADLADAIQGGRFEIGDYVTALKNAGGTVESTYTGITDGTDDAKIAFNQIKVSASELGSVIVATLTPILKSLGEKIKEVGEWFSGLSPEMKKTVLVIAGIAAAIGPLLIVGGALVTGFSAIAGAVGTASIAIGVAGGIMPAFGLAIAAITGPIGLTVLAIAGIVAGGIALYKHFSADAIPAVQLFGKETSDATQKAVGAYMDLDDKATKSLMSLNFSGKTVSKETADTLIKNFDEMGTQIKVGMDKHYGESLKTMQDFFGKSSVLTTAEEATALAAMTKNNEDKKKSVDDGEKAIKLILDTASAAKRALTTDEQTKINEIQTNMKTNAVKALSDTELESKAILERMKNQSGETTAKQAAEVVKNSLEQKDKAVKNANDQYNDTVKAIIKQRDETGSITAEQADKLIKEAGRQKDESVTKATEMNTKVVEQAKLQAKDHVKEVDWTTGEIKSKWQVMKEDTATKMDEIGKGISDTWADVKKDTSEKWGEIKTAIITIWDGLLTWFRELPGKLQTIGSNMFTAMKNGVMSTISGVKDAVVTGITTAIDWIKALPGQALQWGKDIIMGIVTGIKNAAYAVGDAVKGVAQDIRSFLHFSVPDQGLLVDYESWMPDFMGGLAKGIAANKYKVTDAIRGLSTDVSLGMNLTPTMASITTRQSESGTSGGGVTIQIINQGTLVGSNGMKEFAKTVSTEIARTTGLTMGGAW